MGLWSLAQSRHPKQRNHPDASASQPSLTTSGRFAPIVLKKSSLGDDRNFLEPLMRFARDDVRDHIVLQK
jgi:hypothetical protein